MAILESNAVVLRSWKMGETSTILSLYTENYGKLRVIAKGGRSLKSKFKGCIEPLNHIRIVYYEKKTRDLQLLSKTDLIDPHYKIIGNPLKTALALAVAELVEKTVETKDPTLKIFNLLVETLESINSKKEFLEGLFWFFEGHLIDYIGFKPKWNICLHCSSSLGSGGGFFHPDSGGLLCKKCGSNSGGLFVESGTLEILFFLQMGNFNDAIKLKPTPSQKVQIRKLFNLYFKTHIEYMHGLKSLDLFYTFNSSKTNPDNSSKRNTV